MASNINLKISAEVQQATYGIDSENKKLLERLSTFDKADAVLM